MKRPGLIPVLLVSCTLAVGALGCAELSAGTHPTETTSPPNLATVTTTATTSTTTAPPTHWTKSTPSPEPSVRVYPAMACDSATGKVYLFGGEVFAETDRSARDFNDLWVYAPATGKWAELHPSGEVPSARSGADMVYDPSTGKIFLFGGEANRGLGDLWAYDPAADVWTKLKPTGDTPAARSLHAMVYDAKNGKILLFGGSADRWVGGVYQGGFNDLWSYDPAANAWTQLPATGKVPSARSGAGMVYDSAAGKLIVFGGTAEYVEESPEPYPRNDLWAYDQVAGTWTELHATGEVPSARWLFGMAYDPACSLTILFGGSVMDADLPYPETLWAYDSAANAWKKLQPAGRFPYGRQGPAMVYDPTIGGLVMFGGFNVANGHLSGTWTLTP